MSITADKHGHLLKSPRARMGEGDLASCIRCGKAFKTPLEDYSREECEPGSLADKLFLDDERKLPIGYNLHAKTVEQAIQHLTDNIVWHVSLDHDLDEAHYCFQITHKDKPWDRAALAVKTGYSVLEWMHQHDAWVPDIQVHSLSTGANDMMTFLRKHAPEWVEFRRVKPREI